MPQISGLEREKLRQRNVEQITRVHLAESQREFNAYPSKPKDEVDPVDFATYIMRTKNVTLLGGPFHYQVRSGTYGDPYDEIPWKLQMGLTLAKGRLGVADNPLVCNYGNKTLINNWVEEHRDREFIKYDAPRISQYGHHYQSENMRAYKKPYCNKARDVLLKMKSFPISAHPYYQPELSPDTLRHSVPTPESCIEDRVIEECRKEMEQDKRYFKAQL